MVYGHLPNYFVVLQTYYSTCLSENIFSEAQKFLLCLHLLFNHVIVIDSSWRSFVDIYILEFRLLRIAMVTYRSSFYTDNLQEIGIFLTVLLHNIQLVKREGNSVFNSINGEIFRNVSKPDNPELEQ